MKKFKVKCPNNSKHKRFIARALVIQEWEVDENGKLVEVINQMVEVSDPPYASDDYECMECATECEVETIKEKH